MFEPQVVVSDYKHSIGEQAFDGSVNREGLEEQFKD